MITEYTTRDCKYGEAPPWQKIKPGEMLVLLDENGVVAAVDFHCPCGCGSDCYTPVTDATKGQAKTERHWLYSRGPNGVTLTPSIRYTSGCRAHFNITDGKVIVHGDSGK